MSRSVRYGFNKLDPMECYLIGLKQLAEPQANLLFSPPETFADDAANLYNDWVHVGYDLATAARRYGES